MNNFELIENYLKGKLQGDALKTFESRLASDSDFASEVEEHKAVQDMIFMKGMLETKEKLNAIRKVKTGKTSGGNNNLFWQGGLFVISLLLFIGGGFLFFKNKKSPENIATLNTPAILEKSDTTNKPQESIPAKKIPSSKNTKAIVEEKIINDLSFVNKDTIQSIVNTESHKDPVQLPVTKIETLISTDKKSSCNNVHLKAIISTEESCTNKSNGTVSVSNVSEGSSPYQYSIDNSEFTSINFYHQLEAGTYHLVIKDANGCVGKFDAKVGSKSCDEKTTIFSPDQGETWKFPVPAGSNCKIHLYDPSGSIVYETTITNGYPSEWDGTGNNGSYVKAGAYLYHIKFSDGTQQQGTVTLIR